MMPHNFFLSQILKHEHLALEDYWNWHDRDIFKWPQICTQIV